MSPDPSPYSPPPQQPPARSRMGYKLPVAIVVVVAVGLAIIQGLEQIDRIPPAEAFLAKASLTALGAVLLFVWLLVVGPWSRRSRTGVGVAALVAIAVLLGALRLDGVSGDIMPRLRFRWTPRDDEKLPSVASEAANHGEVNLAETTPDDSPEFMGRGRLASWSDTKLDRDWAAHPPKLIWRRPIGAGWSSFAVVGHYGVTQEQRGPDELVSCYDINDGKVLWAHSTPVRFYAAIAGVGPRSTPTIHDGKVYALGAMGHLVCLDGATGREIWKHQIVEENGGNVPEWGKSCAPLVYENKVIVSAGGPDGKSLVAYDAHDGKLVWSAGDDPSGYSSPTVLTLCGVPQIVIINAATVVSHDPADGHVLWSRPWPEDGLASPNVAQPIAIGENRLLVSKGYSLGSALWELDHADGKWQTKQMWRNKRNLKTKFTSAVVRDGYAYALDENVLACVEVANGKNRWREGRFNHGQVLLVGDLLLVQSETGDVALVEASPAGYHELGRIAAVTGQSWNYPTLVGNRLLVRTEQEAACYELPLAAPAP